jgi:sugar phosphate isomerase/epimerase
MHLERAAFDAARGAARRGAARNRATRSTVRAWPMPAEKIEKAAFTRADLIEIIGAPLPVDTEKSPRQELEAAADEIGVRLTAPRGAHQREGHERSTLDRILAEEVAVLDLVDALDDRSTLWIKDRDTADLRRIRSEPSRTLVAYPGSSNRCRRRLGRARPPRCAPS